MVVPVTAGKVSQSPTQYMHMATQSVLRCLDGIGSFIMLLYDLGPVNHEGQMANPAASVKIRRLTNPA